MLSDRRPSALTGALLVIGAGFILSLGVFAVRNATASDAFQYLFWRAIGFTAALIVISAYRGRTSPWGQVRSMSRFGAAAAVAMALSQTFFISSVKVTTFGETFLICALAPLFTAILARPLLGEHIDTLIVVAIALALTGVALMVGSDVGGGSWLGRLLALVSALAFAAYTLSTRGSQASDLDATLLVVGLLIIAATAVVMTLSGLPFAASARDAAIAIVHGAVILSAGLWLFGQGSRSISAVSLTLLAQMEAILAPLWGYLYFGEAVTQGMLVGGAMVLTAIVLQSMAGTRALSR
jgi:drug/metabolite transporter (DMT)-like permease